MVIEIIIGSMTNGVGLRWDDPPYQEYVVDEVTYRRWENTTSEQLIGKLTSTGGVTTREKAKGLWSAKETLTYAALY